MFDIVSLGALYAGSERGLAADVLAARALGGSALTVCTSIVAAGPSGVTDVTEVPADTVDAQLEHILKSGSADAVKIGIVGNADSAALLFKRLERDAPEPILLDLTLSGPSGEDVADGRVREVLRKHLDRPDLVSLRRIDAELMAGMEIRTLDDAQVAVQRLHRAGARRVLIRAGRLPARFFEAEGAEDDQASDLYFDGEDFALFEAPFLNPGNVRGASSAFLMSILKNLSLRHPYAEAIQNAKAYVTEALRRTSLTDQGSVLNFTWHHASSGDGA